jgi:hypothetical protein
VTFLVSAFIACWFVTLVFLFIRDRSHWERVYVLIEQSRADRERLLDRIMARDFAQYKQADLIEQHILRPEPRPDVEPEDFDISDVGA